MTNEFSNLWAKNWNPLKAIPLAFLLGVALGVAGSFSVLEWQYDERIEAIKDYYQKQEETLHKAAAADEHKVKAKVAALVDAAKKIDQPQNQPVAIKTAGRHLSQQEKTDLANGLAPISTRLNRKIVYAAALPNEESQSYLAEIMGVFQASNINMQFSKVASFDNTEDNRGLFLGVKNKNSPPEEAQIIFVAMRNAGLNISYFDLADATDDKSIEIVVGY